MLPTLTTPVLSSGAFDVELAFTRAYQDHRDAPPAVREARCLAVQFPAVFLPIEPDDWFAGRARYRTVGFTPQKSGGAPGIGYFCDEPAVRAKMDAAGLGAAERAEVEEMLAFWRTANTLDKIRAAFSPELQAALPSERWTEEPGLVFPLYRMAGIMLNYDHLLQSGIPGLMAEVRARQAEAARAGRDTSFYEGGLLALEVLVNSALYLAGEAEEEAGEHGRDPARSARLRQIAAALRSLTQRAPRTLHEAIQLVYLYTMHTTLQVNFGRMDVYLGDFYAADLAAGRLTEEEALAMLGSFWRMMAAYPAYQVHLKFDARVITGGRGRRNEANADAFALLAMETSRRHRGVIPQLTLRCYTGMNEQVWQTALDLLGEGLTFPILYNDDANIPAVAAAFDVEEAEAAQYVPFGCGEYVLDHASFGTPNAIINMAKALEVTLANGRDPLTGRPVGLALGALPDFATFDDLLAAYRQQVEHFTAAAAEVTALIYDVAGADAAFLFPSLLYDDCLARGQAIFAGGVRHLGGTYETYGDITAADSLTAIRRHVYERGDISPQRLLQALEADFAGYEQERQLLLGAPKFGNDDDEADGMAQRLHDHVCHAARSRREHTALDSFLVVSINNDAHILLGRLTGATADGRLARQPLTNGHTAGNGMERNGITALLNSMVKLDPSGHAGATHNLKFSRAMFGKHRPQLEALLETYFDLGGTQAMLTVVDRAELEAALREPEKYANLIVRVGGFSARFVDLPRATQQEIISRTMWE